MNSINSITTFPQDLYFFWHLTLFACNLTDRVCNLMDNTIDCPYFVATAVSVSHLMISEMKYLKLLKLLYVTLFIKRGDVIFSKLIYSQGRYIHNYIVIGLENLLLMTSFQLQLLCTFLSMHLYLLETFKSLIHWPCPALAGCI